MAKKINLVARYDFCTIAATSDEGMNVRERLWFHYFNPNGVYKAARAAEDKIAEFQRQGKCNYGSVFAYGYGYCDKRLTQLAMRKRVTRIDAHVCIKMLRDQVAKAEAFIASVAL